MANPLSSSINSIISMGNHGNALNYGLKNHGKIQKLSFNQLPGDSIKAGEMVVLWRLSVLCVLRPRRLTCVPQNPSGETLCVPAYLQDGPSPGGCAAQHIHLSPNHHSGSKAASLHCTGETLCFVPGPVSAAYLNSCCARDCSLSAASLSIVTEHLKLLLCS